MRKEEKKRRIEGTSASIYPSVDHILDRQAVSVLQLIPLLSDVALSLSVAKSVDLSGSLGSAAPPANVPMSGRSKCRR